MKSLGLFDHIKRESTNKIPIENLNVGYNDVKSHIVAIDNEKKFVIDKICDHQGGRLILKGDKAICPMHDWRLDLKTLKYNHSHTPKKQTSY